ncbi:MAG: four helix bundle suffix domain-containing protein [bacterium]
MPQSYKDLFTYRFSLIIYDLTVEFCRRWILDSHIQGNIGYAADKRLADQMVQAARSGKQNIASASLEELIEDYEDFLVRNLNNLGDLSILSLLPLPREPEIAANLMLTLGHQATFLLSRQITAMEQKHIKEGGYTEKLYNQRINYRRNNHD